MYLTTRTLFLTAVVCAAAIVFGSQINPWAGAADAKAPDKAAVERARTTVKMLDDVYKLAVVTMTDKYVENQANTPAAEVAKEVFKQVEKKGWHKARLIDATGKPKNKENVARTPFEKIVVEKFQGGATYHEEIVQNNGKPVLRAATVVPAVMKQCVVCHGKKEGSLLGAIVYEIPIQ